MEGLQKGDKVTLDELPEYYEFVKDLLNQQVGTQEKSHAEVFREFETDKWGKLLEHFSNKKEKVSIEDVDNYLRKNKEGLFPVWDGQSFILDDRSGASESLNREYQQVLSCYLNNASCLVELGAGYGSNLFKLAKQEPFDKTDLFAAELTRSGIRLMEIIAADMGISAKFGFCDIYEGVIEGINVNQGALVYTSYAMCYRQYLDDRFIKFITAMEPEYVVHFEPVYEHMSEKTMHGLLCRKYMKSSGYTENLLSVLKDQEDKGRISICEERKTVFGINPLLPMSVIVWRPNDKSKS